MSNGLLFMWIAAPQGVAAAEDDDCGSSLQLTEGTKGTKCCNPAVATHTVGTSMEKPPQLHTRGWDGKKEEEPSVFALHYVMQLRFYDREP